MTAELGAIERAYSDGYNASSAKREQLRSALEILKLAVDREGWPAGWGLIRKQVSEALNEPPRTTRPSVDVKQFIGASQQSMTEPK